MRRIRWTAVVVSALVVAGCAGQDVPTPEDGTEVEGDGPESSPEADGDGDGDDAGDGPESSPAPEDDAATDDPAAGSDAALGEETAAAISETGADPDDVEVREATFVTWPDGALGCPEDGMMYTQALVEGYRIVLVVDGEEVTFHGAAGQPPFRCEDPRPPAADAQRPTS